MDIKHHCNGCPYWYVTKKEYPSGFYNITICRKYEKQIYYLAGDKNRTPYPCSICEKEFSYVPYMEQELLQEVEKMTERLSDRNPCTNCKADRQIGNPNRWQCECDRCDKPIDWKNDCVKKLAEYETAEDEGRLVVLPCKVGDTVHEIRSDYTKCSVCGDKFNEYECQGCEHECDSRKIYTIDEYTMYTLEDIVRHIRCNNWGETIFTTREEAEKALKEMEGKHE